MDVQPHGHRAGQRNPPTYTGRTGKTRSARPGRPPSRRRNRPRATGRSGPTATSWPDAAALRVCVKNRTCVRRVCTPSDGTRANRCLCGLCALDVPAKWLNQADSGAWNLQRELRGISCLLELERRRPVVQKRTMPPARAGGIAFWRVLTDGALALAEAFAWRLIQGLPRPCGWSFEDTPSARWPRARGIAFWDVHVPSSTARRLR